MREHLALKRRTLTLSHRSLSWHPYFGDVVVNLSELNSTIIMLNGGRDKHIWRHSVLLLLAWVVFAPLTVLLARHRWGGVIVCAGGRCQVAHARGLLQLLLPYLALPWTKSDCDSRRHGFHDRIPWLNGATQVAVRGLHQGLAAPS